MADIKEIGRDGSTLFGAIFRVCANAEVIGLATGGSDPTGNGWKGEAIEATTAAGHAIWDKGYDYTTIRDFHRYNGGGRRQLVEVDYYTANLDTDSDGIETIEDWERLLTNSEVPAELVQEMEQVREAAEAAMCRVMEEAAADQTQTYQIAHCTESGDWDILETFEAADDDAANAYAAQNYAADPDWYVLRDGQNVNA
jgi:hypothetical protein